MMTFTLTYMLSAQSFPHDNVHRRVPGTQSPEEWRGAPFAQRSRRYRCGFGLSFINGGISGGLMSQGGLPLPVSMVILCSSAHDTMLSIILSGGNPKVSLRLIHVPVPG